VDPRPPEVEVAISAKIRRSISAISVTNRETFARGSSSAMAGHVILSDRAAITQADRLNKNRSAMERPKDATFSQDATSNVVKPL
jgi:hypothetical protein